MRMINIKKWLGLTFYISQLDQFLTGFDKNHQKLSPSQKKEKEKYARIHDLRDHPTPVKTTHHFWDAF
jgi:hypothetical protein